MTTPIVAEKWLPIHDCGGAYEVSSVGRVRKGKRILPTRRFAGYVRVALYFKGKTYDRKVHRLVATAFIGDPPDKGVVNHINHIKDDNRVENLEWCSMAENNRAHAKFYGGKPGARGERHRDAVLNEIQARIILACERLEVERGWKRMLSRAWGVNKATVLNVARGRSWSYLTRRAT